MGAAVLGAVVLVLVVAVLVQWPPLVDLDAARHDQQVAWTSVHLWAVTPARLLSVAGLALVVVPVAAVTAWDQLRRGRALLGWWLLLTLVAGWLATWGLKELVARDRPPTNGLLWQATTASFPSGHASVAVYGYGALAVLAWWVLREGRRGWVVASLALLGVGIAASRLVLAVHWTTDVVAGYLTGAVVLMLTTTWLVGRATGVVTADDLSSAGSGRNR